MESYKNKPRFLTSSLDTVDYDDFSVVADRKILKNLAASICNTLHHPVTIVDINRLNERDSKFPRIESDVDYFSLRESCRLFRIFAGETWCHTCDQFHASCLTGGGSLQENLECAAKQAPGYFYDEYKHNPPKLLNGFSRQIIEYRCPMLGYRELIFPISIFGETIGCLFLGQIVVKESGDLEKISIITESFFSKFENQVELFTKIADPEELKRNPRIVMDFIIDVDKKNEQVNDFISLYQLDRKYNNNMTFQLQSEYLKYIQRVCDSIDELEKDLNGIYIKRLKNFFAVKMAANVKEFFNHINESLFVKYNSYSRRKNELEKAWEAFRKSADRIQCDFGLKKVYLFGDGVSLKMEKSSKKGISPAPSSNSPESTWTFDFSQIESERYSDSFVSSLDEPSILLGLTADIDKENAIVLAYHGIAVLFVIEDYQQQKNLYKYMMQAIGDSLWKLTTIISLCSSNLMKEKHVLTLRMNRHESSHISTRLNDTMGRYFSNEGQMFTALSIDKQKLVVEDMRNTIKLISHMASNIGVITGSINKNNIIGKERQLDVFDLLYKWQIMFRDELKDRNLDIIVIRNSEPYFEKEKHVDAPRYITINSELFELLIYNLVDNAVKYAHRGSKIYLSWKKNAENRKYKLSVISFGPEMKSGEDLYELYARGDIAQEHMATGDGIGLYVVRRISELLNLQKRHCSNFIYKFHVPLVNWFLKERFSQPEIIEKQSYVKEYCGNLCQYIINSSDYTKIKRSDLSKEYLMKRIDRETWQTIFSIEV